MASGSALSLSATLELKCSRVHVPLKILEYGIKVAALGAIVCIVGRHFAEAARRAGVRTADQLSNVFCEVRRGEIET